ncbi:hypothetical protein [Bifidobacterium longum]
MYTTGSAPQGDFTLAEAPEGEVSYQSVNGTAGGNAHYCYSRFL